jgi:5-formyltetrahydrofolate cyclo-ligase
MRPRSRRARRSRMTDLLAEKAAARGAAVETRATLHRDNPGAARRAAAHALDAIGALHGVRAVSAYLPMRSEIDPTPLMLALAGLGYVVAAPVIQGRGLPLAFRRWTPGAVTTRGPLGTPTLAVGESVEPDVVVAPLLAFDAEGWRLGYGGGYYDRSIAALRERKPLLALGFAFAGQKVPRVPHGPNDARLDGIVTEGGLAVAAP